MKNWKGFTLLATSLIGASALLYFVHYLIFRDLHNLYFYLVHNLAFLPLEVFLVVIVVNRLLARREKQAMLHKLNMVIGAFFSEVGNESLRRLLPALENTSEIKNHLHLKQIWTHQDFQAAQRFTLDTPLQSDVSRLNLPELRAFLLSKRGFLLGLLENPNLLENERFTELLWAAFHFTEELESRQSFDNLPESDLKHLSGDMNRFYRALLGEWVSYSEHLKNKYPYLYSLVLRLHPFQETPSPVVKE
ncbi:MAG: hypothetical protein PHE50_01195 [Dehalococcoidales bacterium]|nr:hypothetical protein [Dehalococcoidales bacterium]